jgi:hypothetical protein
VISPKSIIEYIANRKGGVHFDPSRNLSATRKNRRKKETDYRLLDHGLLRIGHLSGPAYEVVSAVHAITDSEWCTELIRIGREVASNEFDGDPAELKFWSGTREADGTGWATTKFGPL